MMGMHFLGILRSFKNNASKLLVLSCVYELQSWENARSSLVDLMLQARPALVAGENGSGGGEGMYFDEMPYFLWPLSFRSENRNELRDCGHRL